jgi:hypothetical protein
MVSTILELLAGAFCALSFLTLALCAVAPLFLGRSTREQ